jgi:hypothetical protein
LRSLAAVMVSELLAAKRLLKEIKA